MRAIALVISIVFALLLIACPDDDDDTDDVGDMGGSSGTLQLAAADEPGVTPCPNQDILTDATELEDLKTAILQGALVYLDVPFDPADPDIFAKKCGFENSWNPADNIDEVSLATGTPVTISNLLLFGNAGICAADFTVNSFGVGEGFPENGTYRKEFRAAFMGMTYHVRMRVQVSGSAAGTTFASESIAVPGDIENTLVYEVNGTATSHADVLNAVVDALTASDTDAPSATLAVRMSQSGPVIFQSVIELICASKM